jgi:hypothetical protein
LRSIITQSDSSARSVSPESLPPDVQNAIDVARTLGSSVMLALGAPLRPLLPLMQNGTNVGTNDRPVGGR